MRLGTSSPLSHDSVQEWAAKQKELGCRSLVFPLNCEADDALIDEYAKEARANDLLIAEVGIWRNAMSLDPDERQRNRDYTVAQLKLADRLGARCAVNVTGAFGPVWEGGYKANFTPEAREEIVKMIREVIDRAEVSNTYFTVEPMPWMVPTGPEDYLKLIEEVDREHFAVHMDIINMTNSAERYFEAEAFIDRCASLLGDRIRSCHIKDIHLKQEYTIQMAECAPGEGEYPLRYYVEKMNAIDKEMPVILEHLNTDEEYIKYMTYLKEILNGI